MLTNTLNSECYLGDSERFAINREIVGLSFEELYNRYYRLVYSLCLRMTSNRADAEDLTHDTLLHVKNKIETFRGDSSFTSWLHRVTVNQVLMHFRKKRIRYEQLTETGDMPERIEPSSDQIDFHPIIDRIALASAIEKLPPGYRTVFLLHDVEGYDHMQVGEILGISDGTSKSQLHKSRMRLREILQEQASAPPSLN